VKKRKNNLLFEAFKLKICGKIVGKWSFKFENRSNKQRRREFLNKKILLLPITALILTSCASASRLEKIRTSGKITVYTTANFPPFEYIATNEIRGVDIEIAKAVAEKLDAAADIKDADFDGVISALASGKGDMAISAITITEDKKNQVDFSNPYIETFQYMILPADSEIKAMEDLAGKRVSVALGYTGQTVIEREIKSGVLVGKNVTVNFINNAIDGSLDVINGKTDVLIMDEFVAKKIADGSPKLKVARLEMASGEPISEKYGVALPKNSPELLEVVNQVIAELIQSGKISAWLAEYSSML
jgi:polar amino acid transport system substrate-binding protein